jgi:hypothetical protein
MKPITWKNTDLSNPIYEVIESSNAYARFPYRYFVFGSADDKIIRAKAITLDKRDEEMWSIELRRYYVRVAKRSHCELVHISVGDCFNHFHSIVMSSAPIKGEDFMKSWSYCDMKLVRSGTHKGRRKKEVRVYDPTMNGVAYCYDHHHPFQAEHITSRRVWSGWKQDVSVSTINTLLKDRWTYGSRLQHQ